MNCNRSPLFPSLLLIALQLALAAAADAQAPASAHGTGLKFATQDQLRGVPLAFTPFSGAELPPSVDLSGHLPTPGQQGRQNSCVAWTIAYALKSFEEYEEDHKPYLKPDGQPDWDRHFSPAFIYNQINGGRDGGSLFIDALNALSQTGAVPLSVMPYKDDDFTTKPTPEQVGKAKIYRIDTWRQVNVSDIKEVKAQLNANYPVAIGATVDDGLLNLKDGEVWKEVKGEPGGGHAMLVVGYDDSRSAFKLLNSWGRDWGSAGYGWIDYGLFTKVVHEGYVAKDAKNGPAPVEPVPIPVPPTVEPSPAPRPAPPVSHPVQFRVTDVQHNQYSPFGLACMVRGDLSLPEGTTGTLQIVVQFYRAGPKGTKGDPVGSKALAFATYQGAAATGTPMVMLSGMAVSGQPWYAAFPYQAFNLPGGFSQGRPPVIYDLVAEPVLYINNFGVAKGQLVPMKVGL